MTNIPTNCPACNSKLEWSNTGTDLFCVNNNCTAKIDRKLLYFFQVLNNLDGFGPIVVQTLAENGFDTIPKIYNMNYQDFEDCGYKYKTIMNLGTELAESKERRIYDYTFLAALGIPNLGLEGSKKVLERMVLEDIFFILTREKFENILYNIDGFGYKKIESIADYLDENMQDIIDIYNIGFNIIKEEKQEKVNSPISGKIICFTGKSSMPRKDMQEQAKQLGAFATATTNSKTDILVCGKNVGNNKIKAAEKFNVEIMSEKEYMQLIKDFTSH